MGERLGQGSREGLGPGTRQEEGTERLGRRSLEGLRSGGSERLDGEGDRRVARYRWRRGRLFRQDPPDPLLEMVGTAPIAHRG